MASRRRARRQRAPRESIVVHVDLPLPPSLDACDAATRRQLDDILIDVLTRAVLAHLTQQERPPAREDEAR
jgi:hypothetical protein